MTHTRARPYQPQTQGKIERYHESLDNVTPSDVYHGRHHEVLSEGKRLKQRTMQQRKKEYRTLTADQIESMNRLLEIDSDCPKYSDDLHSCGT